MVDIRLDGLELQSLEAVHDRFALVLPDYYGRNLDALHDCLTALSEETRIRVKAPQSLPDAPRLLRVLRAAAQENPRLTLEEG